MPEDRGRDLTDDEVMLLFHTVANSKQLFRNKLLPIAERKLFSVHSITDLHNKIRRYIDAQANLLVENRSRVNEAQIIDDLISYLLIHRVYMTKHFPGTWGVPSESDD